MAVHDTFDTDDGAIPVGMRRFFKRRSREFLGLGIVAVSGFCAIAMASYSATDPSLNNASNVTPQNLMGAPGAVVGDLLFSFLGLGALALLFIPFSWALKLLTQDVLEGMKARVGYWLLATLVTAGFFSCLPQPEAWPIAAGLGGQTGDILAGGLISLLAIGIKTLLATLVVGALSALATVLLILKAISVPREVAIEALKGSRDLAGHSVSRLLHRVAAVDLPQIKIPFLKGKAETRRKSVQDGLEDTAESLTPAKGITRGKPRIEAALEDVEETVGDTEVEEEEGMLRNRL